jgi:hypothetical protein
MAHSHLDAVQEERSPHSMSHKLKISSKRW